MEKTKRSRGKEVEETEALAAPNELTYLWNYFNELNSSRTGSGFAPNPIQWGEILAWMQIKGFSLYWWELELIKKLDLLYISICSSAIENRNRQRAVGDGLSDTGAGRGLTASKGRNKSTGRIRKKGQ